jgi:hypothetical protein
VEAVLLAETAAATGDAAALALSARFAARGLRAFGGARPAAESARLARLPG